MTEPVNNSAVINQWLQRLREGDLSARQELIQSARTRLVRLARVMLREFPGVRRWEETDDVFQNAVIRLCRSLDHKVPDSAASLIGLAARDIRCALIDLARHYYGPQGHGAHHGSVCDADSRQSSGQDPRDDTHEPVQLASWSEFHEQVQGLPPDEREVIDIVWYQGLSQADAAELLNVSERTVQRRWRQACLSLQDAMKGLPPGI